MPFTFSHPAIVLPFYKVSRRYLSLTALIIGTLAPDFEYFIRMRIKSTISHSILGLFTFDIIIGLLLSFAFHIIVRNVLIDHLPLFLSKRLSRFKSFNWVAYFKKYWYLVIFSLLIGAFSHIFWDSFTHGNGYFTNLLNLGNDITFGNNKIPLFKILQHSSTITGGIIILFFIYKLPLDQDHHNKKNNYLYWLLIGISTLFLLLIRIQIGLEYHQFGHIIVSGIACFFISQLFVSFIYKFRYA